MHEDKLLKAALALVEVMDKTVDKSLPKEIAEIVKFHSKGAAVAALGAAWLPGAGAAAAMALNAGFVWSMYARINTKIDVKLSENIIKTVASGVATNLASNAIAFVVVSTALSFLPGIGSIGSSAIMAGTCYALTLAAGFVYLKILTQIFKAKADPSTLSADDLKDIAKSVVEHEDIKSVMKEAKDDFIAAKARGEIVKE